jgi:GTPase SAR1 family protein
MMAGKEFKILLVGAFGSGRTTFASSLVQAKSNCKKLRTQASISLFFVEVEADVVIAAIKTDRYPIQLQTSAGLIRLDMYDSQLHAKGGLPSSEFFRSADAALLFYDITKEAR